MKQENDLCIEFGYLPLEISETWNGISIFSKDNIHQIIHDVNFYAESHATLAIDKQWFYPPANYPAKRIFSMPKTHVIKCDNCDNKDEKRTYFKFIIWCLGFFYGIRLTTEEAGFIDATPIKLNLLVDFIPIGNTQDILEVSNQFWHLHSNNIEVIKALEAIIHLLFLSRSPQFLCYEQFMHIYIALDACFALAIDMEYIIGSNKNTKHSERIIMLCDTFNIQTPHWTQLNTPYQKSKLALLRNDTFHEGLFFQEPLGFSIFQENQSQGDRNTILEMQNLVSRILISMLMNDNPSKITYLRAPVNTHNKIGLEFIAKPHIYLLIKDKLRILGNTTENKDGSITGILYRNHDDLIKNTPLKASRYTHQNN